MKLKGLGEVLLITALAVTSACTGETQTAQNLGSQIGGIFWAGLGLATLFYFTRIGNNIVSGVASWVTTNASGVMEGA